MKNIISYEHAISLKEELDHFINVYEKYEINNLSDWVIKNYVSTYSISKVIRNARENEIINDKGEPLSRVDITNILKASSKIELYKYAKRMYRKKVTRK